MAILSLHKEPKRRFTHTEKRKKKMLVYDFVMDMTTVMPRFELLTICIIVKCYVLTNTSKYMVMLYICPYRLLVDYLFQVLVVCRKTRRF